MRPHAKIQRPAATCVQPPPTRPLQGLHQASQTERTDVLTELRTISITSAHTLTDEEVILFRYATLRVPPWIWERGHSFSFHHFRESSERIEGG